LSRSPGTRRVGFATRRGRQSRT